MTGSPSLNGSRRARELESLAAGDRVDVLVIGGGINGCGVALDAASRGLSVALLERRDLAFGTSRWSSKLIHGGLRYLAHGDFGLAWESARERAALMGTIAPHLIRALPFLVPLTADVPASDGAVSELGIRVGNLLRMTAGTRRRELPSPRRIGAAEVRRLAPAIAPDGLRGGLLYWDGQLEDDARLVVAVARTAGAHGARILTYCTATRLFAGGVEARDELSGRTLEIRADHTVNATGVWAGDLEPRARLEPSRGVHIIVPAERFGHPQTALTVPVPGERGRWVFAVPTGDQRVTVGVTDERAESAERDSPAAAPRDIELLLTAISRALSTPLDAADVLGSYAGLRPLLRGRTGATADLSRRHAVIEDPEHGTLTLVGGKLTTYRAMAQDIVDRIASRSGVRAGPCRTRTLPLVGAAPPSVVRGTHAPERLIRRYGVEAPRLIALADGDPELLDPLDGGRGCLGVELTFAVEHELALTVDDLLDRRTRIGLIAGERARSVPAAEAVLSRSGHAAAPGDLAPAARG